MQGYRFEKVHQAINAAPSSGYVARREHALRSRTRRVIKVIRDPVEQIIQTIGLKDL